MVPTPGIEAPVQQLLELAFLQGPAREANSLIDTVRRRVATGQGRSVNYEVVLTGRSWDYLRRTVAPLLALFLRSKKLHVQSCSPVFLSLFLEDRLFFVMAPDFFSHLRRVEGMSEEELAARARVWEVSGRPVAGILPP